MSEYWKSTPKYWCKHCSAYVKDTPFERKQHENTAKHQGNLKRFLRTIQHDHEREERDKNRAKAEIDRLNKVVGGTSESKPSASSPPSKTKPPTSKLGSLSAADQKRQWAQLAEMGIQIPESARGEMAMASNWNVVSRTPIKEDTQDESLNVGVRKRKFEGQEEEEEAGDTVVRKGWGSTTKRYPGAEEDDIDGSQLTAKEESTSNPLTEAEREIKNEPSDEFGVEGARTTQQKQTLADTSKDQQPTKQEDLFHRSPQIVEENTSAPMFKKRRARADPLKDSKG